MAAATQQTTGERDDETTSGWVAAALSLRALAVALEDLAGPEPDTSGWSSDLSQRFMRYEIAADVLTEVANMDSAVLRAVAGPDVDDEPPVGHRLLVAAAIRLEQGLR